jgi:hypothetical protein
LGAFFIILVCSGCTSSTQRPPETITPAPVMTTLPVPTSVPVPAGPYPDALTAGQYATFGSGNKLGHATVFSMRSGRNTPGLLPPSTAPVNRQHHPSQT